ncbi:MAG: DUF4845 domain-containing protein [Rubrivivax sp.]
MHRHFASPRLGSSRRRQAGLTFAGLLVYGLLVAAGVFVVMKVLPSVTEYQAVKSTIRKVAQSNPASVEDARRMFDRQRDADPSIQSITGNDLAVTKEGGRVVISVKYEKELRMAGPVSLLIRYEASSD